MSTEALQRWSHALVWIAVSLSAAAAIATVAKFYVDRAEKRLSARRSAAALEKVQADLNASREEAKKSAATLAEVRSDLQASHVRVAETRERLATLAEYREVSRLNYIGKTGMAGPGLKEESSLSKALEPLAEISGNRFTHFKCDETSIRTYAEIAEREPRFPFSHFALADCLKRAGDPAWTIHAHQAIEILKKTTAIDGHHKSHDEALEDLEAALNSRPVPRR